MMVIESTVEQLVGLYGFMLLCIWYGGAIQTKAICRNISEIIMPGGLPPPLFLPPTNSLKTWIHVFMGFPVIHLTPESMLILTPQEDVFSELLRQESGAGVKWNFSSFVFLIFVKCISLIPQYLGTAVSRADGYRLVKVSSSRPGDQIGLQAPARHPKYLLLGFLESVMRTFF